MEPYDLDGSTAIDLELTLQEDPYDQTLAHGIDHVPFWKAKPILAGLGETQVWAVTNSPEWSHPLHLHGFFFLVLDEAGEPVGPPGWKDTVDIPHERTVRSDERPGTWIFHCHILDHADGGLLSAVHLGLPPEEFRNLAEHWQLGNASPARRLGPPLHDLASQDSAALRSAAQAPASSEQIPLRDLRPRGAAGGDRCDDDRRAARASRPSRGTARRTSTRGPTR